jgi:hypothetical protein
MLIYGIEFSQQVKEREFKSKCAAWLGEPNRINNNKEDTIKLVDEIKESNDKLGKSSETSYWYKEIKARIEIPPKQDCRVM